MSGDIIIIDGIEYEVIWSGADPLIPPRDSIVGDDWTPPLRLYNWSGKFKGKFKPPKAKPKVMLDNLDNDKVDDLKIDFFGEGD